MAWIFKIWCSYNVNSLPLFFNARTRCNFRLCKFQFHPVFVEKKHSEIQLIGGRKKKKSFWMAFSCLPAYIWKISIEILLIITFACEVIISVNAETSWSNKFLSKLKYLLHAYIQNVCRFVPFRFVWSCISIVCCQRTVNVDRPIESVSRKSSLYVVHFQKSNNVTHIEMHA